MLSTTGFNFTQPSKPTAQLKQPPPPILSLGTNAGEIICKTTRQSGMRSVNYYITSNEGLLSAKDGTGWDIISYNKTKYTFSELVSGQRYYIRVGLVGVRGQEVISDYVTYIPQ